jgi:antitoxin component YwqK of YwqJK toxin-antitoxin module
MCRDKKGRLEGPSVMTFADGGIRNVAQFVAGKSHGPSRSFEAGGDGMTNWRMGVRHGSEVMRDSSGHVTESEFDRGVQAGHFVSRFPDDGIEEEGHYVNREKHGLWRESGTEEIFSLGEQVSWRRVNFDGTGEEYDAKAQVYSSFDGPVGCK